MTSLTKFKKADLIKLVNTYEDDIHNLHIQLEQNASVKYIVIDSGKDDAKMTYIKKRIKCVSDNQIYINELERITKILNTSENDNC